MEAINTFLNKVYDKVGLSILNDAAKNVPQVRLAGAALLFMMLAAAGVALFGQNIALLVGSMSFFIILIVLVILLGAVSKEGNHQVAEVFTWAIVILFVVVLTGITSSFLFEYPRPIRELFAGGASLSLKDAKLTVERDSANNLIIAATDAPQQPYSLDVQLFEPSSDNLIGKVNLPMRNQGDASNQTSAMIFTQNGAEKVKCVLTISRAGRVVDTREIVAPVKKALEMETP